MSAPLVEPSAAADATAKQIVGSAFQVHMTRGPACLKAYMKLVLPMN